MQLDPETRRRLRDVEAHLHPDADTLERIHSQFETRRRKVSAPQLAPTGRRRTMLGATASVALVGACLWAAIAFAPDREGDHVFDGPRSAAAALNRAGSAAASKPWTPLAPGEFHRVYEIDVTADVPDDVLEPEDRRKDTDSPSLSNPFSMVHSKETWLDTSGRGFSIQAFAFRDHPEQSMRTQLRHANDVTTLTYPRTDRPAIRTSWLRAPKAYRFSASNRAGSLPYPNRTHDERVQVEYWGTTAAVVDRMNALSPENRRDAIERMLVENDDDAHIGGEFGMVVPGTFGETRRSLQGQQFVERAIKLLGRAPLSPDVRRTLFDILASQSTARLDGSATDGMGRTGTAVTFLTTHDEVSPAETISLETIRAEAFRYGITKSRLATLTGDSTYDVPARHERRTWYVRIIFDVDRGELLQQTTYATARADVGRPHVAFADGGGLEITSQNDQMAGSGSTIYVARDRTATVKPMSPVCENRPVQMCRYR